MGALPLYENSVSFFNVKISVAIIDTVSIKAIWDTEVFTENDKKVFQSDITLAV
jgi:hypothetical protein